VIATTSDEMGIVALAGGIECARAIVVAPSRNVIVPVGMAFGPVTVAVNVTDTP